MATMKITSDSLTDIADSIRAKLGVETTYLPSEMAGAIDDISGVTPEDEGKVVVDGTLVGQTSLTITSSGTYDTTTNDEVVVRISGGGYTHAHANSTGYEFPSIEYVSSASAVLNQ